MLTHQQRSVEIRAYALYHVRMYYQAIAALTDLQRNATENVSETQASTAQDMVAITTHSDSLVTFQHME